jgi:Lar family restriction alleviation protein
MSEDLKPCPFCGGKAWYNNHGNGTFAEWYECEDCGASTRRARRVTVDDWNRRVGEDYEMQ